VSTVLRAAVPAVEHTVYLNTGSAGPLLTVAAESMRAAIATELAEGRAGEAAWIESFARRGRLREAMGTLVGAKGSEIALTHHTTEGVNIALWGLGWKPGDRLLTSSLEHPAVYAPLAALARVAGVEVVTVDVGDGARDQVLAGFAAELDERVRCVVVSHVAWSTGAVMPIAELAGMAHGVGAAILVDGAQAVGNVPVDVAGADVDFYSFNGYKWLCGPEGTGGLVVRERWLDRLAPVFWGAFGVAGAVDPQRLVETAPAEGAVRYESGSGFRPLVEGFLATLDWRRDRAGEGHDPLERITGLAAYATERLASVAEVRTPAGQGSGLVACALDGDAAAVVKTLASEGITARVIPDNGYLRLSVCFFNTENEIDRTAGIIQRELRA
jgi:L-cysteine/cystine lyase